MTEMGIDQLAAVKASLELMVQENNEVHEYFTDLLEKLSELEALEPEQRRARFKDLSEMGAFRFNNLDIRFFTQAQPRKPLPPPLFLTRTRRRLKNTGTVVQEFGKKGVLADAEKLLEEIELLSSNIVNENDNKDVKGFKERVEQLRETEMFRSYMSTKKEFVQKDADFRSDTEFLAAKESVEEGEELLRQRGEELAELGELLDQGEMEVEKAQSILDDMAFDKTD